jgi:hypothetical protein
MSLRRPDSRHDELRRLAEQEGISINEFIATAATEKLSALRTASYLKARAQSGSRKEFEAVLAKIPDLPVTDDDEPIE